jgi:tetratricopeptide (TPR) repeat protein
MEYLLTYTKEGNVKARAVFEKAIGLDPKYAVAYLCLGWNYVLGWVQSINSNPKGLERALQLAQQSVTLDDSLSEAHSLLAAVYVHKGQYDQAVNEAERAITLDPNDPLGYDMLAEIMNVMGRPTEALAAVGKAMRVDPRNPYIYQFEQGWAYTQLGRYAEAIPALTASLISDPNIWSHVFLVDDYTEIGQDDAAQVEVAKVERIKELEPNAGSFWALAHVLNTIAKPAEALVALEQAMRLDSSDPERFLREQGMSYTQLGRYEEAISAFKRYTAHYPENFWIHALLVEDYIELGANDAARAEAAEVLRLNPHFYAEKIFPTVGPKGKVLAVNDHLDADLRNAGLK